MISRFEFKFEGPAVAGGLIAVRDFAPAALAAGELVERANKILNAGSATVSVRLRADSFSEGSFETIVHISFAALDQAKNLLLEGHLKDAREILEALGFWVTVGGGIAGGLIALLRRFGGRKPKRALEQNDGTVVLEFDGEDVRISGNVSRLYNDPAIRRTMRELVTPLDKEGIESVTFSEPREPGRPQPEGNRIKKTDREAFRRQAEILDETDPESEFSSEYMRRFAILNAPFSEDYVWRLSDGENKFAATVDDEEFLEDVKAGTIAFSSGSMLEVLMRSTTSNTVSGKPTTRHVILKVLKVIPPSVQILLNFTRQDSAGSE